MRPTRNLLLAALLVAFAPGAVGQAFARPRGFGAVVRKVESHYHLRRTNRFLMWAVSRMVGIAHPDGVLSLKLAILKDQGFAPRPRDAEFQHDLDSALEDGWRPLVRAWSRRDVERSYIYAREDGENVRLFIVSVEAREGVVMEVKVSGTKFSEMVDHPGSMSHLLSINDASGDVSAAYRQTTPGPPVLMRRPAAKGNPQ